MHLDVIISFIGPVIVATFGNIAISYFYHYFGIVSTKKCAGTYYFSLCGVL